MTSYRNILPFIFLLFCLDCTASKKYIAVLDTIFSIAKEQQNKSWYYVSEYYYKGDLHLKRKNALLHFAPNRRYFEKGGRTLFSEVSGTLSHRYKDHFRDKEEIRFDAVPNTNTALEYNRDFFAITLYEQYLLRDHLLSPLCRENAHYYHYKEERRVKSGEVLIFFKARRNNAQLTSGHFIYDSRNKYITRISFNDDNGTMRYNYIVETGKEGDERYWPVHATLNFRYRFYGNIFDGKSEFFQKYTTLDPAYHYNTDYKKSLDLTDLYKMDEDTNTVIIDSLQIARRRCVPLSADEVKIYSDTYPSHRINTTNNASNTTPSKTKPWIHTIGDIGEVFFHSHSYKLTDKASLYLSRMDLGYSGSRGVTLRQDIDFTHTTSNDHRFSFITKAGYYFSPKQLIGHLRMEYEYIPQNNGIFSIEFGTKDISNSTDRITPRQYSVSQQPQETPKGVLFNDRYIEAQHSIEAFNGFDIHVGAIFHQFSPHRMTEQERNELRIMRYYHSFAPHVNITYTPAQRYYFKGKRKIRLTSHYPTFSIDYERGLRKVLNSDNQYEKWETTVSQLVNLTPTHSLFWTIGGGMFTNKEEVSFVNYRNFSRGVMIYNWNDERSGVFQLLNDKYYYDSTHYLRMHLTLESPTILLGNVSTRYLYSERLYFSNLFTEGLAPYIELGYVFSTIYFDVNIFGSYLKQEGFKQGVKFTLHL